MTNHTRRKPIWWKLLIPLGAAITFVGAGIATFIRDRILQMLLPRVTSTIAQFPQQPLLLRIIIGGLLIAIASLSVWIVVVASTLRRKSVEEVRDGLLKKWMYALISELRRLRDDDWRQAGDNAPKASIGEPNPVSGPSTGSVIDLNPPPHFPPPHYLTELPEPPKQLIGRKEDLDWVMQRLLASDSSTFNVSLISGMRGIGKSALVATAADLVRHSHPDRFAVGIVAIRCGDDTDTSLLLQRILERFDSQRRRPPTAYVADMAQSLLGGKDALIILDDVGPMVPVGKLLRSLNVNGPHIVLIMRDGIPEPENDLAGVGWDAIHGLKFLSSADALELFAQSYGREGKDDLTEDECVQAARIVEALECHTHAIRIIAAKAKLVRRPLEVVAGEVESLSGKYEHPYMLAFVQSISALPDSARRLLAALAVFAGEEFGRDVVIDIGRAIGIEQPGEAVDELVRRYLVIPETNRRLPRPKYWERLRVHSTLRAHVKDLFKNLSPELQFQAHESAATHYANRVEEVAEHMRHNQLTQNTQENRTEQRVLSSDPKNITGALEWAKNAGKDELIMQICNGMSLYWLDRWQTEEAEMNLPLGISAAKTMVRKRNVAEDQLRLANLEFIYARVLRRVGKFRRAERVFRGVLDARRRDRDKRSEAEFKRSEAEVWYQLGIIAAILRRFDQAKRYYTLCLNVARELESLRDQSVVLSQLGRVARARGDLGDAERLFNDSLAIAQELPQQQRDQRLVGVTLGYLGRIARARGQLDVAEGLFRQSLEFVRDEDEPDRRGEGRILSHLGRIARTQGKLEAAEVYFEEALHIAQDVQVRDHKNAAACQGYLGRIALTRAQEARLKSQDDQLLFDDARRYFEASRKIAEEVEDQRGVAISLSQLGRCAFEQGRLREASRWFHQSLRKSRRIGDRQNEGVNLYRLGKIAERRKWVWQADRLYIRALEIARQVENQADIADSLLALGRLRARRRSTQEQGCSMLSESARLYETMGMPKFAVARAELERSGCS